MRIVLLGPPSIGRDTLACRLAQWISVPYLSTGRMLREVAEAGSRIGTRVKGAVEGGRLVADKVVVKIVAERLSRMDARNGFVLDGPRTESQAIAFDEMLLMDAIDWVFEMRLSEGALAARLLDGNRGMWDNVPVTERELLKTKVAQYRSESQSLSGYYRAKGIFRSIDASQPASLVMASLLEAVGARI